MMSLCTVNKSSCAKFQPVEISISEIMEIAIIFLTEESLNAILSIEGIHNGHPLLAVNFSLH